MSQQFPAPQPAHHAGPGQPQAPKKESAFKKPVVWLPIVTGIVAFAIGAGAGGSSTPAAAEPAPAVTVTAEPLPAVTMTAAPKIVEKAPAACLEYVTLSEQAFSYAGESMGYMSAALVAASDFDTAEIERQSAALKVLNPKLTALTPQVNAAKAACKAQG